MKIHYFQRYHQKENVATANTMLLLSRLYASSPNNFFQFCKSLFLSDTFDPEIVFNLQEKSMYGIPDATITQEGFKIIVETKLSGDFDVDQLSRHIKSFNDQKYKVLLTIAPEPMYSDQKNEFDKELKDANLEHEYPILHVNTTFEEIHNKVLASIEDRDYEMHAVLADFLDYCNDDNLIKRADAWRRMRMQLAGATFDFNFSNNLYYNDYDRKFSPHKYLGLYKNKSVRAIGKIIAIISRIYSENRVEDKAELGALTEERKRLINDAIKDGKNYGYNMETANVRYFFVDQFFATDFKKITPNGAMGTRFFDLAQILETKDLPETEKIAELLKSKTWE